MEMNRIIGAVVFAIGVAILAFTYQSTNAPLEPLSPTITGRYGNAAMLAVAFTIGVAAAFGGVLIALLGNQE